MPTETQTQSGMCKRHGKVVGTREIPRLQFPFIVYGVQRWLAKRRPFVCPECGDPLETG